MALKVLRGMFSSAHKQGLVTQNVASMVPKLKQRGESKRRPFSIAEIKRVLAAAKGSEMEGLVLFGLYVGQRLGDLARLTWRAIDLEKETVSFVARKTGRRTILPLAKPLIDYLATLPVSDNPDAALFPRSCARAQERTAMLSGEFHALLASAGLADPRPRAHCAVTGKGRNAPRPVSELSFHCLRHSATSFLKAAGVSDALAMAIIGHESAAISRNYTHLSTEDLRGAIEKLPDITRATSEEKK